jgi:hypothetical protein
MGSWITEELKCTNLPDKRLNQKINQNCRKFSKAELIRWLDY